MKKIKNLISNIAEINTVTRPNKVKSKVSSDSFFIVRDAAIAAGNVEVWKEKKEGDEKNYNLNNITGKPKIIKSNLPQSFFLDKTIDPSMSMKVDMVRGNHNKDMNKTVIPTIFKQNVKNNLKLKPFNDMRSDVGDIQYFPAWSKEWRNSVYHYNSNIIKNFPVYDINIVKIIKGYFNIYFNNVFLKYKHILNRKRILSYNKIFFARPEIKHTNSKGIVTLYTFNRENFSLSQKIKFVSYFIWRLTCLLRSGKDYSTIRLPIRKKIVSREWIKIFKLHVKKEKENLLLQDKYKYMSHWKFRKVLWRVMHTKLYKLRIRKWVWSRKAIIRTYIQPKSGYLNKLEKMFFKFNIIFVIMKDINLLQDFYSYFSVLKASKIKAKEQANNWVKILWKREFAIIRKYKFKLNLNKYKFEEKFLGILSNTLSKIYSKQIEFNIVNLKNIVFNTDLFTEISTKKIQKRNTRVSKIIHIMLNKAKLPRVNRIQEKGRIVKNVNYNLIENKYRTLDLKYILSNKLNLDKLLNNTYLNYIKHSQAAVAGSGKADNKFHPLRLTKDISPYHISNIFLSKKNYVLSDKYYDFINRERRSPQWVWKWWKNKVDFYTKSSSLYYVLYNLVFSSIKYKNMGGIRMEVKGRLTPRYRADRSVFKLRWKGGLKNVDSSYKGLSVRKNRGHLNPNVGYSIFTSKRRVGAFAVKGWMAGKSYSTMRYIPK